MTALADFFGIFAGCAAAGDLIGRLLRNAKTKNEVNSFIKKNNKRISSYVKIIDTAVFRAEHNVFGLKFGFCDRFFSFQFFASSILISLLTFSLVLFLQIRIFDFDINSPFVSWTQFNIFVTSFIANCIFDMISVRLTKAFFSIARHEPSGGKILLILISDLLITFNIFMIFYAAFVGLWTAAEVNNERSFRAQAILAESPLSKRGFEELRRRLSKAGSPNYIGLYKQAYAYMLGYNLTDQGGYRFITPRLIYFVSNKDDLTTKNVLDILSGDADISLSSDKSYFVPALHLDMFALNMDLINNELIPFTSTSDTTWINYHGKPGYFQLTDVDVKYIYQPPAYDSIVDYLSDSFSGAMNIYGTAYNQVIDIQQDIPFGLFKTPSTASLHSLISEATESDSVEDDQFLCLENKNDDSTIEDNNSADQCNNSIFITATQLNIIREDLAVPNNIGSGAFLPSNTLCLTSLSTTILCYFSALLLAISSFIHRVLPQIASRFEHLDFVVAGGLIGLLVATIAVIVTPS